MRPAPRSLAAIAVALAAFGGPAASAQPESCRPTKAAYSSLSKGMHLATVQHRLGCKGRRMTFLRVGHQRRATYSWFGHGTYGANITLTFVGGKLSDKSQLGLR